MNEIASYCDLEEESMRFKDQGLIETVWAVAFAVLFLSSQSVAQIVQVRPFDIGDAIRNGTTHVTIAPPFAGDTLKPFDGNQFTAMEFPKSDSLIVTLSTDSLIRIEKSKVFFWSNGTWSLEVADSLSDLDGRWGSYVKLVDARACSPFQWDSVSFSQRQVKLIRLRARNLVDSSVFLGEWTLERTVRFTSFFLLPNPLRVLPGTSLQAQVKILDDQKNVYPNFLAEPITWRSSNTSIATVDENGKVTGVALGTADIIVSNASRTISGSTTVIVDSDFKPEKVRPMTVKVALVIQDPAIPSQGYDRIHELFRWRDPMALANRLISLFREASDSVMNFQFVDTVNDGRLFTRYYGSYLTAQQYYTLLQEPNWKSLKNAADSGQLWFDYRKFVSDPQYQFDLKRNNGQVDEIWVFAGPYLGMYESQLLGPNAFWWNSPPIRDGTALTKLLSVMGLNYERGVDQAFHSFGHRVESAISQAYYQAQGRTWNDTSSNPTPWDLFTRIDKRMPAQAHVGNIHYPPNGASDYNYGNTRLVKSYAENWLRYPYLLDQSSMVNVNTWYYAKGDPLAEGLDHLGYLSWWYYHLPRYVGVTEGVLNNWWHYAIDYEGAVVLAKSTPVVSVNDQIPAPMPTSYSLKQNFPNPFNPTTVISYQLSANSFVMLKVFDVLGREIATLVNERQEPGSCRVTWNASSFPSGVYFYRLQVGGFAQTNKMLLIR